MQTASENAHSAPAGSSDPLTAALSAVFPPDVWRLPETGFDASQLMLKETLLGQGNGYVGSRGTLEEGGAAVACEGVYLNGLYSAEPIVYGESAYGFATQNQKMLQVPSGKWCRLQLDGEWLNASLGDSFSRSLDLRDGILRREQRFTSQSGKVLQYRSGRLVSATVPGLMLQWQELTADNFSGELLVETALDASYQPVLKAGDPRIGQMSARHALEAVLQLSPAQATDPAALLFKAKDAPFLVGCLMQHQWPAGAVQDQVQTDSHSLRQLVRLPLGQGQPVRLVKWLYYGHQRLEQDAAAPLQHADQAPAALAPLLQQRLLQELGALMASGFDAQLQAHSNAVAAFWQQTDVELPADVALQQGMRFNLFSLFQYAGRDGQANIGAKGLSGPGYDGHYFWDTEIYVVPVLSLCQPALAKALLQFRVRQLDAARQRAREMSHAKGALYPWRTIGGTECSAYFPAGTAQYHINAAIAYALRSYYLATGDFAFIADEAAGMLFETARLWLELGFFGRDGAFEIHQVTGPDEYTALVNNNFYTNAMAQLHLRFAVRCAELLTNEAPAAASRWRAELGLSDAEVARWQQAADQMKLPYDDKLGIHAQDDQFLQKKVWDFAGTPADQYPLLLHFHPLVIYRHQVLKQADVVLAMVLLDDAFTPDVKARNLAYYEPLTTHDSSLSTCIHSLACAELGQKSEALAFLHDTLRMDLDNRHHNTEFGVHIACMAGSWLAVVAGFAGLRVRESGLYLTPQLPAGWPELKFRFSYQGRSLEVRMDSQGCSYRLCAGAALTVYHAGEAVLLTGAAEVWRAYAPAGCAKSSTESSAEVAHD